MVGEKGTHNVKFLTKNYTKKTILSRTRVWATARKAPRLQPPARTAARYATHAQRSQQHANAEVICHLQLVFWLVKNALNAFCLVAFLKHNNALPLSLGGRISNFIVSLSTTAYMSGVFTLILQHKETSSSQFIERLKVNTTSLKEGGKQG